MVVDNNEYYVYSVTHLNLSTRAKLPPMGAFLFPPNRHIYIPNSHNKPGRFLTSHQPGTIRAGNEAGKCGRIPGKRVLWRQGMDMKKRILTYLQFSLQGTGVAALGTLNIYEPKAETLIFGGVCIICGLIIAIVNKEA